MRTIIIFCPFRENFEPVGGSPVRIKGYVSNFDKKHVDYILLSKRKPAYISEKKFIAFNMPAFFSKLFLLHNVFYNQKYARPLVLILKFLLLMQKDVRKIRSLFKDKIVITHQENSICYFLYIQDKIEFIYDIHGILSIQEDYKHTMNRYRKFWFRIQCIHEALLFENLQNANCINENMQMFLRDKFGFNNRCFMAPDGILDVDNSFVKDTTTIAELTEQYVTPNRKIILFFGEFKYFGGVQLLTEIFADLANSNNQLYLILIGTGQMENTVKKTLDKDYLTDRYFHIPKVSNDSLKSYMAISDVITIPDLDTEYNRMIPHIKLYDSLTSGRPLVVPDFEVNRGIVNKFSHSIFFFKPGNVKDMKKQILAALQAPADSIGPYDRNQFFDISYEKYAKELISQYNTSF